MKRGIEQTIFIMFALIVFLVVTVIVIQMFFRGTSSVGKVGKYINLEAAKKECKALSEKLPPVEYCNKVYSLDLNGDSQIGGVVKNPATGLLTCESSVFCYSILDEPSGYDCIVDLCKYYIDEKMLTPKEATIKVFGKYKYDFSLTGNIERIIEQLGRYDRYKDKETGILFIGKGCYPDEIFKITWRTLLNNIYRNIWDIKNCPNITIETVNGVLAVNKSCLKKGVINNLQYLYVKVPNEIELCAVVREI